ncbi:MAG: 23S rRNA (uracil(1939)-C(5))-methyltransferase RlmD [Clostridiales bacterium]|nr:23S rRNA (uracil(1939)-C(5))-methyltransferase RlmD [Candidatus Crickella merdequi]
MNKGDIISTRIIDMTAEGAGLGRVDGMAVFVDGCIPGDKVQAEVTKAKKNFAQAKCVAVLEESEDRIQSACPYSERCGGCQLQEMDYSAQLKLKHKQVKDKLERLGGLENPVVNDTVGQWYEDEDGKVYEPFKYRNKGEYPVWNDLVGFYERKSHKIVPVDECLLQSEAADVCARAVKTFNKGDIKQLIVKTAFGTGEVMVILEGKSIENAPYLEDLIYAMDEQLEEIEYSLESVYALNDGKYRIIAGKKTIIDEVEFADRTLQFEISAPSFYQVNTEQMKKLYGIAADYAGLTGEETILDIYCGIGTIGLSMADKAKFIVGIEVVKDACLDANRNSVINGILNSRYVCGKAEEVIAKVTAEGYEPKPNSAEGELLKALQSGNCVAVLDPPRAGCDEIVLKAVADANIPKIVYISCDPGTLARDIKILGELGYEFKEATPVDMFPWTGHVETVCLLSKKNS